MVYFQNNVKCQTTYSRTLHFVVLKCCFFFLALFICKFFKPPSKGAQSWLYQKHENHPKRVSFFFQPDTNIFQISIFSKSHLWLWCQIHVKSAYLHVFIPKPPLPLFIRRQIISPDRFCTRGNMLRAFPIKYHHRFWIGLANPSFSIKPLGKCLSLSSWAVWSVSKMCFFLATALPNKLELSNEAWSVISLLSCFVHVDCDNNNLKN